MVLINIDALSDAEIRYIAQQEELENYESLSREELIEELEELYGDDIHEKEKSGPKFVQTILSTSSDVLGLPGISDLPTNFSNSNIHFTAVDFNWAYAFWNIAPLKQSELEDQNASLLIRVTAQDSERTEAYDIAVNKSDTNWSIELPWDGMNYYLSLIAKFNNGNEEIICQSNKIYRERPYLSVHKEVLSDSDTYKLLVSSMVSKEGTLIDCSAVQRILSEVQEDVNEK